MTKSFKATSVRFVKFSLSTLFGALTDTGVLWLFSHYVFSTYLGRYVISPIISFECAVLVNFFFSYYVVWKDRVSQRSVGNFFKRYGVYNVSCTGVFLLKIGLLQLIHLLSGWGPVICNLLAVMVSGIVNFLMSDKLIFRIRKEDVS